MSIIQHQSWFFEGDVHHVLKEVEDESTFVLVRCFAGR
jgi:hypothetical protein